MKYYVCVKCYHKHKEDLEILGTNTSDACDVCKKNRATFIFRFKKEEDKVEVKVRPVSG